MWWVGNNIKVGNSKMKQFLSDPSNSCIAQVVWGTYRTESCPSNE